MRGAGQCQRLRSPCCLEAVPAAELFPYVPSCLRGCLAGEADCWANGLDETSFPRGSRGVAETFVPALAPAPSGPFNDSALPALLAALAEDEAAQSQPAANSTAAARPASFAAFRSSRQLLVRNEADRRLLLAAFEAEVADYLAPHSRLFEAGAADFFLSSMALDPDGQR